MPVYSSFVFAQFRGFCRLFMALKKGFNSSFFNIVQRFVPVVAQIAEHLVLAGGKVILLNIIFHGNDEDIFFSHRMIVFKRLMKGRHIGEDGFHHRFPENLEGFGIFFGVGGRTFYNHRFLRSLLWTGLFFRNALCHLIWNVIMRQQIVVVGVGIVVIVEVVILCQIVGFGCFLRGGIRN